MDDFTFDDFNKTNFDSTFEQVQTICFKFILNINKFASNHAIRAESGKFLVHIYTDLKLVKYWHRLECLCNNSILIMHMKYVS